MFNDFNDRVVALMETGRLVEAVTLLRKAIEQDPSIWWYWYMAGYCYRFLNDLEDAITYFKKAVALKSDEPSAFLGLGIALQLTNRFNEAIDAFRKAIEIDPDYALAYNSAALTRQKQGKLELALHNYDAGLKALTRRIVKSMRNHRSSRIFKHRDIEHHLWCEYCCFGAMYLGAREGLAGMMWPTGDQAEEEERTERHGGLYWVDYPATEGHMWLRSFLPNFFNTFREILRQDRTYADLIGNRGTVFEQLDRREEANQHFAEAEYFLPRRGHPASRTLHEAMRIVLMDAPGYQMHAAELADAIYARGLYVMGNGERAKYNQIRARCGRYPELFEALPGNIIKLRNAFFVDYTSGNAFAEDARLFPYRHARDRYRPAKVRALFIGESRPANGTYFYYGNSNLFNYTKQAFEQAEDQGFNLDRFRAHGCWLYDVCDNPVNQLEDGERSTTIIMGLPLLQQVLHETAPEYVFVIKRGVFGELVYPRILNEGYVDGVTAFHLPFPACGQQNNYVRQLADMLRRTIFRVEEDL